MIQINYSKTESVHGLRWNIPGSVKNVKQNSAALKLLLAEQPLLRKGTLGQIDSYMDRVLKAA